MGRHTADIPRRPSIGMEKASSLKKGEAYSTCYCTHFLKCHCLQFSARTPADFRSVQKYTRNGVPCQEDSKKYPNAHTFMHAYHHPARVRPDHEWVDWFCRFKDENPDSTIGLEFVEGLWAEKLVAIALLITVAIVVVSIVWVVKGGDLQTVFTVMSFVLTGAAGKYPIHFITQVISHIFSNQ